MGKSTISMAIFNSYVCLPEGSWLVDDLPVWKKKYTVYCCWSVSAAVQRIVEWTRELGFSNWLVVDLPLWKIWKSVGIVILNIWKNNKCSKPPTKQEFYKENPLKLIYLNVLWQMDTNGWWIGI